MFAAARTAVSATGRRAVVMATRVPMVAKPAGSRGVVDAARNLGPLGPSLTGRASALKQKQAFFRSGSGSVHSRTALDGSINMGLYMSMGSVGLGMTVLAVYVMMSKTRQETVA